MSGPSDPTRSAEPRDPAVSTAFLGRLAARARSRRWTRTRAIVVALAVVAVLVLAGWVVLGSSVLAVRTVEVRGLPAPLAAQVHRQADGVVGRPLARVDLGAVEKSVAQVAGVTDVVVTRKWPHTVSVHAVPRTQAATVRVDDGYQVLDPTGVVLATRVRRPDRLPFVKVGSGPGASLADGLTALRSAPLPVRTRVDQVEVRSGQDIRLVLSNGIVVRWGGAEDSARKAAVLSALLAQKARVYDVSAPDLPTTRK